LGNWNSDDDVKAVHASRSTSSGGMAWQNAYMPPGDYWIADEFQRLEPPGLMLGLAGTGYSLLRAARPQILPSLLTFAG
jgi:hypothetical protein